MRKQILSDEEIKNILDFNKSRQYGIRPVDLYRELKEKFGLYEAEKEILSIMDISIVLTEYEKKRAALEGRACMATGDVRYNPDSLRCPECGCKYIVYYHFVCYLREKPPADGPQQNHRLMALSNEFGEEYNYCLGCGTEFSINPD